MEETRNQIGFFAFWDSKRSEYHATEEDEVETCLRIGKAFDSARQEGARIYGHYYCRWSTERKTFTFWTCPNLEVLDRAMNALEKAGDFKFAESYHLIGASLPQTQYLDGKLADFENGKRELEYAFAALWRWRPSYYTAPVQEKVEYNQAVDKAFFAARNKGVQMLGQFNCRFSSNWDVFTLWLSPNFSIIEEAMEDLEEAGDFKFAESRHFVGQLEYGNRFGRNLQKLDY